MSNLVICVGRIGQGGCSLEAEPLPEFAAKPVDGDLDRRDRHPEIAGGLMEATATADMRTSSIKLSLPLDIRLPGPDGDLTGDLPLFRTRTDFDPEPGRIGLVLKGEAP